MTPDGKSCVDRNECLDNPCKHGGVCHNRDTVNSEVPYVCRCMDGYMGTNCELMQKEQILRLSMGALAIILFCLLFILSTLENNELMIFVCSLTKASFFGKERCYYFACFYELDFLAFCYFLLTISKMIMCKKNNF